MRAYVLAALLLAACSAEDPAPVIYVQPATQRACEPGDQKSCACLAQGEGVQVCSGSGNGWSDCECPDAAATDAPIEDAYTTDAEADSEAGVDAGPQWTCSESWQQCRCRQSELDGGTPATCQLQYPCCYLCNDPLPLCRCVMISEDCPAHDAATECEDAPVFVDSCPP